MIPSLEKAGVPIDHSAKGVALLHEEAAGQFPGGGSWGRANQEVETATASWDAVRSFQNAVPGWAVIDMGRVRLLVCYTAFRFHAINANQDVTEPKHLLSGKRTGSFVVNTFS
jgi:hypothetical protein